MLQQRDPSAIGGDVQRPVLDEFVVGALLVFFFRRVPDRTVEAEGFRVGHAALEYVRHARQVSIDVAGPGLGAAIDDFVAHFQRVFAACKRVGAADADAFGAGPHVTRTDRFGTVCKRELGRGLLGDEAGLMAGCALRAGPAALGDIEILGAVVEQTHQRRIRRTADVIFQQFGATDIAAVEAQSQHIIAERDPRCGGGRGADPRSSNRLTAGGRNRSRWHRVGNRTRHGRRRQAITRCDRHRRLRDLRRRRSVLLLVPVHPEDGRHHQPGENQESAHLVHEADGLVAPLGAGACSDGGQAGGIVPFARDGGNAARRKA